MKATSFKDLTKRKTKEKKEPIVYNMTHHARHRIKERWFSLRYNFNPESFISAVLNSIGPYKIEGPTSYFRYNRYTIVVRDNTVITLYKDD